MPVLQPHIFYYRGSGCLRISQLPFTEPCILPTHKMEVIVIKGGCRWKNTLSYHGVPPALEGGGGLVETLVPKVKERLRGEWNRSQHIFQGDSVYKWPEMCRARGQSAFENPACHILEVLRIRKCLWPFLQRDRPSRFFKTKLQRCSP